MSDTHRDPEIQYLLDEAAIRRVLSKYGRGIDRMDHECLLSMFWPGAIDELGIYNGPIEGYVEWLRETHRSDDSWMHHKTTQRIEIEGDEAFTETYCLASNREFTGEHLTERRDRTDPSYWGKE